MFLLLIFFMVSSTFREQFGVDITLPEATTATQTEASAHEITVTADGELYFGQQVVNEDGLRASISELLDRDPGSTLVLRADDKADFGKVIRAIDIAREVGGTRLIIPTQYTAQDREPG